jgi:RNA polymerase sigma-70 factor (ECF subfamily)
MTDPTIHATASGDLEAVAHEIVEIDVRPLGAVGEAVVLAAWDRHHDEIYALLLDATRNPSVAEDLLQDAFIRLLREVRSSHAPEQLRAWLYRVAANLVVDRGRRIGTARHWFDRFGVPGYRVAVDESPEAKVLGDEAEQEMDHVLGGLPADARAALLLAAEGFTGREIAQAIGRSEAATRTLLCRARVRVRHDLTGKGGER